MITLNERLRNLLVLRAVSHVKFERHAVIQVQVRFRVLTQSLLDQMRGSGVFGHGVPAFGILSTDARQLFAQLVQEVKQAIQGIHEELKAQLSAYIELQVEELPDLLREALLKALETPSQEPREPHSGRLTPLQEQVEQVGIALNLLPSDLLAQVLNSPLGGATYTQTLINLSSRIEQRLRSVISIGQAQGLSTGQLNTQIRALMQRSRKEAEQLVRSEFVRTSNQAALLVYEQNKDALKGVQWHASLDLSTCLQCGDLDGRVWTDISKAKIPVQSTHGNCKCVLTPIFKSWRELGLDDTPHNREVFSGIPAETITYPEWFADQSGETQKEILGPTRYRLYSAGKVTFKDFVTSQRIKSVQDVVSLVKRRGN